MLNLDEVSQKILSLEAALRDSCRVFNITLRGSHRSFGFGHKTIGALGLNVDNCPFWVKVARRGIETRQNAFLNHIWSGEEESRVLPLSNKPVVVEVVDWHDKEFIWRAQKMSYIADPVFDESGRLLHDTALSSQWLETLRNSLKTLSACDTKRRLYTPDIIKRILSDTYGLRSFPCLDKWCVAHGDLHWGNLSRNECFILDWEGWGLAPFGTDIAFLLAYSCYNDKLLHKLETAFADILIVPGVRQMVLFAAQKVLGYIAQEGYPPEDEEPLRRLIRTYLY